MTDRRKHTEPIRDPAISRLYRGVRREEPSAQLDAKILTQAQSAARHRRRRWLLPLSSAAVVLLGLTFTLKLLEQAPRLPQIDEEPQAESPVETKARPQLEKRSVQPAPTRLFDAPSESFKSKSLSPAPASRSMGGMRNSRPSDDLLEALERDERQVEKAETPDQWLARIQGYLERGDRPQALSELKAFLARYPDHPLPEALQELE